MHAAVGRVVTADWGQAYLHPEIGRCHEENFLWAIGDAAGLDATRLAAHADRLMGDAGLSHRRVVAEGETADRMRAGFRALGYDAATSRFMAHDGGRPPAPAVAVEEVGVDEILPGEDRYLANDPDTSYARDPAVRAHLVEHHRTYGSALADERFYAVRAPDGGVAAWCKLWTRDGVAQVEDVVCLLEHRGRGFGRAVVSAARRAALDSDPELLFIVADADDWPQQLYERIGYRPVGFTVGFTRALVP